MSLDRDVIDASAAFLEQVMQDYDNPDDTLAVALTHKQVALIGFALTWLRLVPLWVTLVGPDIAKLMAHLTEVGMAQKLGVYDDETQA